MPNSRARDRYRHERRETADRIRNEVCNLQAAIRIREAFHRCCHHYLPYPEFLILIEKLSHDRHLTITRGSNGDISSIGPIILPAASVQLMLFNVAHGTGLGPIVR
jgi:hypothetical protein